MRLWPRRAPGHVPALSTVLQRSIVLAAALAMLLFATPLAVAVDGLYRSQAIAELARHAERLRAMLTDPTGSVPPDARLNSLMISQPDDVQLGVYASDGRLVAGDGPADGQRIVRSVGRNGIEEDGVLSGTLVVVVPVPHDEAAHSYLVRAARPYSQVRNRTYATWGLMAALALIVLLVVTALARARARQIARPLQQLALAAEQLGHGDFSVRAVRAGVAEVDAVSTNLERTARRLGGLMERERAFSSDASHQLRTPLTAVRLGLESALLNPEADLSAAAAEALDGLDRLEQTVLDLLALARDVTGPASTDVPELVQQAAGRWGQLLREHDRSIQVRLDPDGVPPAAVSPQALRTVLDVLLGNALAHGGGTVQVRVQDAGHAVLVEVSDGGAGISCDPAAIFLRRSPEARGTGIGLALARSLIEADGGRLELVRPVPATFTVVLPLARTPLTPTAPTATAPTATVPTTVTRPRPADEGEPEVAQRSGAS